MASYGIRDRWSIRSWTVCTACCCYGLTLVDISAKSGKYVVIDPVVENHLTAPAVTIAKTGNVIYVSWKGGAILQTSYEPTGPWRNVSIMSPFEHAYQDKYCFFRTIPMPRPARVYVPSSYSPTQPLPLVLSLHGRNNADDGQERRFPLLELAESREFLYCLPEALRDQEGIRSWNATAACCDFFDAQIDDSGYLRSLIELIARRFSVDPRRIYVVGTSNGGFMAYRMACEHADLVAAIVSFAGGTFKNRDFCQPSEPVSVLEIHGTGDNIIPYHGGWLRDHRIPAAVESVQIWAQYNQCNPWFFQTDTRLDLDLSLERNGDPRETTVERTLECLDGAEVELWTVHGGTHALKAWDNGTTSELPNRVIDWLFAHSKPEP